MRDHSNRPSIAVTIGSHMRIYHAFVTTAPVRLDGPSTMTLYTSTFADVAGFAAEAIAFDAALGAIPARLVLVDATELAWQRRRYRDGKHTATPADPVLVGLNTLHHWLWRRLESRIDALESTGATA